MRYKCVRDIIQYWTQRNNLLFLHFFDSRYRLSRVWFFFSFWRCCFVFLLFFVLFSTLFQSVLFQHYRDYYAVCQLNERLFSSVSLNNSKAAPFLPYLFKLAILLLWSHNISLTFDFEQKWVCFFFHRYSDRSFIWFKVHHV